MARTHGNNDRWLDGKENSMHSTEWQEKRRKVKETLRRDDYVGFGGSKYEGLEQQALEGRNKIEGLKYLLNVVLYRYLQIKHQKELPNYTLSKQKYQEALSRNLYILYLLNVTDIPTWKHSKIFR